MFLEHERSGGCFSKPFGCAFDRGGLGVLVKFNAIKNSRESRVRGFRPILIETRSLKVYIQSLPFERRGSGIGNCLGHSWPTEITGSAAGLALRLIIRIFDVYLVTRLKKNATVYRAEDTEFNVHFAVTKLLLRYDAARTRDNFDRSVGQKFPGTRPVLGEPLFFFLLCPCIEI